MGKRVKLMGLLSFGRAGLLSFGRAGLLSFGRAGLLSFGRAGLLSFGRARLLSFGRARFLVVGGVFALSACSPAAEPVSQPDPEEIISGFMDTGLNVSVATCVVGWIDRLELSISDPAVQQSPADQLIIDEAIANCTVADELVNPDTAEPERLAFDGGPFTFGDNPELDALWTQCENSDGRACDRLWELAPIGSEYEEFGVTCGQRLDLLDCTEELSPDTGS